MRDRLDFTKRRIAATANIVDPVCVLSAYFPGTLKVVTVA
jgi:hypothetical protein